MRNAALEQAYVVVLANRNDVVAFLTDPRTKLFPLAGRNEAAGRSVTVAWQEQTRSGFVIGERMPVPADDERYVLWHVARDGRTQTPGEILSPEPSGTVDAFTFPAPAAAGEAAGFRVSVERGPAGRAPARVLYDSPPTGA